MENGILQKYGNNGIWNYTEFHFNQAISHWIYNKNNSLKKQEFREIPFSVISVFLRNSVFRIFPFNSVKNTEWKKRDSGDFRHFFFRGNGNFLIDGIPRKYGNGSSGTTLLEGEESHRNKRIGASRKCLLYLPYYSFLLSFSPLPLSPTPSPLPTQHSFFTSFSWRTNLLLIFL